MGDYTTLYIGDEEFFAWKWETPKEPFLDFVFQPSDKVIQELNEPPESLSHPSIPESLREEERKLYPCFECVYITTVQAAKERLNNLGFSTKSIEETTSSLTGIPVEDVEYILRGESGFSSQHIRSIDNEEDMNHIWSVADGYRRKAERADLGYLSPLWRIRHELDNHPETAEVRLDPTEIIGRKDSPDEFEDIEIIRSSFSESIRLELAYLASARAHFSTHQFHLVYIELATALESAINTFVRSRCRNLGVAGNIENLFGKMSLLDRLKVATRILEDVELDDNLLEQVKRAYDKRNTVIHQGARHFTIEETARAVDSTETVIKRLSNAT